MTGQDIRAFRQRERLSQEALGGVLGVIHSSISNWERGRHIPASHEAKLQELMGASPEGLAELLDGVPRKAEERRKRQCANPVKPQQPAKGKPPRSVAARAANPCKGCPTGSTWTVRKARPCTVPASRRPAMPVPAA